MLLLFKPELSGSLFFELRFATKQVFHFSLKSRWRFSESPFIRSNIVGMEKCKHKNVSIQFVVDYFYRMFKLYYGIIPQKQSIGKDR